MHAGVRQFPGRDPLPGASAPAAAAGALAPALALALALGSGDAAVADPDLETDHDRMIGSEENEVKTVEMSVAGLTGWTRGFLLSSNGRDRDQADHGQDDRGDMAPVALDERRHQPISLGQHERQKWPGTLPPQSVAKS